MPTSALFDEDFLKRLESLKLISRHLQPAGMKGEHRVRQRGSGMEFADFRPYVPGDDVRALDWGAWLRLDKLILRLFDEEGDLSIYLFLDTSQSMVAGDPAKFDAARRLAAAMGYIGLYNMDRVSLVCYADGVVDALPELRGQRQVWRLFHQLEKQEAKGPTNLGKAVKHFFATSRRRGLVILISDFFDLDAIQTLRDLARLRQDLVAISITSPHDNRHDLPHEALLIDSEEGTGHRVRVTPDLRRRYERELADHRDELDKLCRHYGWAWLEAPCELPIDKLVTQIFRRGRFVG